ncbi:MAG: restriction endonuclease subunit S [Thermodesulfobacteriota bacterium]|nr:restriction endonuclease subunit S [Thermodesulfobacteriota bacterium]
MSSITVKIGSGATPRGGRKVYKTSGKYALIRSQNIFDDKFDYNGLVYIDEKHANELNNVTLHENDILLNITGASLGRVHIVPKEILPARVNQHVSIIRVNEKIDPYFLYAHFCLPKIKHYMLCHNAGGTREALTKGMVKNWDQSRFGAQKIYPKIPVTLTGSGMPKHTFQTIAYEIICRTVFTIISRFLSTHDW